MGLASDLDMLAEHGVRPNPQTSFAVQRLIYHDPLTSFGVLGDATARPRCEAGMTSVRAEFEQGLSYLNGLPLSTQNIRQSLDAAAAGWQQMLAGASDARRPAGQVRLANASETLLDVFDQLSEYYEHSMQMLVG